jgi:hypothetical protein
VSSIERAYAAERAHVRAQLERGEITEAAAERELYLLDADLANELRAA